MNFLLRIYAWVTLLQDNGPIDMLLSMLGIHATYIGNTGAVVLGMVYEYLPFMVLPIYTVMSKIDGGLIEAAQDLGCSPTKSLFKVVIPSLSTAILTGALIAFTLSIDDFVISFYTQGNGFSNFSNYVYSSYTKKNFSPGAYAFDALLTFVTLGVVLLASLKTAKKGEKK